MSNNMIGATALQRHASNVFYNMQKFKQKSGVTSKILILKPTSKFQKVSKL